MISFKFLILIVIIILVAFFLIFLNNSRSQKKIRKYFNDVVYFKENVTDAQTLEFIRKYADAKNEYENLKCFIDDTTWNDLDMNNIFSILNSNQTSVGEEYLYFTLRKINFNFNELKEFDDLVEYFNKNKEAKVDVLCILHGLGKCKHNYIYSYIYNINDKRLKNIKVFYILIVLPFISILVYFYNSMGILLIILSCSLNMYIYYKYKFNFEMSLDFIRYISRLVSCAESLSRLKHKNFTLSAKIAECLKPLKKLVNLGNSVVNKAGVQLEEIIDYFKIITMWDFINYNKIVNILASHTKEFQTLYEIVGQLDTAISVQLFRESLNFYCKPRFYMESQIIIKDLYHPLIEEPVYNSLGWHKNIILTGSNASGKSTFIKALAINIICSQTIFTCFCNEFLSKMSFVITSMAVKDNLATNESYFIAEIKSLKRILNNINENVICLCFIDEILKGTNTIERISASSAILNWLYSKNCLTMVASFDDFKSTFNYLLELEYTLKNNKHYYSFGK